MFKESITIALRALLSNKLRSILTMLGIIIGVGAVIAMVSVGLGVREKVQNSIASLGSNMLIVTPGAASSQGVRSASGSSITLVTADADYIRKMATGIDYVAPTVSKQYQLIAGNQNWTTTVQGITPEYMAIRSLTVGSGSFVTERDSTARNRVAVLGATVAQNLFGSVNPVGQSVRINNTPYQVVGVLDSKGQSSMGQDQDDIVMIPLTTAQERLIGINYVHSINSDQYHGNGNRDNGNDHDAVRQYCCHIAAGRRYRHYEHYDGVGNGENPGNRYQKGAGSYLSRCDAAILARVHCYRSYRWYRRYFARHCFCLCHIGYRRSEHSHIRTIYCCFFWLFGCHWFVFWYLSCKESCLVRPDRSLAL
ncbi:MAG: MacB-like periplasmic core domain containing protein [Anaerospora sp.]|nr:MacB-like periplasmic core domain containing protein [Anaerospora sp.]